MKNHYVHKLTVFTGSKGGGKRMSEWNSIWAYWSHEVHTEIWSYDWFYDAALMKAGLYPSNTKHSSQINLR